MWLYALHAMKSIVENQKSLSGSVRSECVCCLWFIISLSSRSNRRIKIDHSADLDGFVCLTELLGR